MPRIRRESNRARWTQDDLNRAINQVLNGDANVTTAAKNTGIPRTTLHGYLKKAKHDDRGVIKREPFAHRQLFTKEEEAELAGRVRGKTVNEAKRCAFEFAVEKGKRPHQWKNNKPGRDWFDSYINRNSCVMDTLKPAKRRQTDPKENIPAKKMKQVSTL